MRMIYMYILFRLIGIYTANTFVPTPKPTPYYHLRLVPPKGVNNLTLSYSI